MVLSSSSKEDFELWLKGLHAVVDFLVKSLRDQRSGEDRLKSKRREMERRQAERDRQKQALGDVGMKFTAQAMAARS